MDPGAVDLHRCRQSGHRPLGHGEGRGGVGDTVEEQRELVTAQAGHEIPGPDRGLEAGGHHAQELVAGGVAQGVVHVLEVVEVHEQHRLGPAPPFWPGQRRLQASPERRPVRQTGQRVVIRLSGQAPLAAGDGVGHGVETDRQIAELIGPVELDTMIQFARGQLVGRISQRAHRSQHLG
jgi:hypothetical protein